MSFQAVLRFLLPKEDHFYDYLEQQIKAVNRAAHELKRLNQGDVPVAVIREVIQGIEHEGDQAVHKMLDALGKTFVTPIDREDLQKLSKRTDDILDLTNAAVRACVLFGVERPTTSMSLLIEKLAACTAILNDTMPLLRRHDYPEIIRSAARVSHHEKDGDVVFRDAVKALFHDPNIDAKTILREKEVLEDIEKAINRCEQVAELLTNIAVKNA